MYYKNKNINQLLITDSKNIPSDFIEISEEEAIALQSGNINQDILKESIRSQRDSLLQKSDWTQMSDVPLLPSDKLKWMIYRNELRNITLQPTFPDSVIWPSAPINLR